MSHLPNVRRVSSILRFRFLKSALGSRREWLALMTAGLVLIQPMVLMAQHGKVANVTPSSGPKKSKGIFAPKPTAPSAPLTNGNVVVYRVGDGSAALSANATAVF